MICKLIQIFTLEDTEICLYRDEQTAQEFLIKLLLQNSSFFPQRYGDTSLLMCKCIILNCFFEVTQRPCRVSELLHEWVILYKKSAKAANVPDNTSRKSAYDMKHLTDFSLIHAMREMRWLLEKKFEKCFRND
jgi:hypothetical protein